MPMLLSSAFALLLVRQDLPSTAVVLENTRKAVSYAQFLKVDRGVIATGKAVFYGMPSTYSLHFTKSGEFVETTVAKAPFGDFRQSNGFDGKDQWESDWTGMTTNLDLEDKEGQATTNAFLTYGWLAKNSPLKLAVNTKESDASKITLDLSVPTGFYVAKISIDRKTWLPLRLSRNTPSGEEVWELSSYQEALKFKFPRKIRQLDGGSWSEFNIEKVEQAPTFIRNPFEPVRTRPNDTTFDSSVKPDCEFRRAFSGHLLVHPKVNGKDLGWFILDSGAGSMVIDKTVAETNNFAAFGEIPVSGIGGTELTNFRVADSLTLGPATIKNPVFIQYDLSQLGMVFGVKVVGIIGYEFFARTMIELDFPKKEMRVFEPGKFALDGGVWEKIRFSSRHPIVQAKFEGDRQGWFRLDTGSDGSVTFHGPTVAKYELLKNRETRTVKLGGVGGTIDAQIGPIDWFELAGKKFAKPRVTFMKGNEGPLADAYTDGNIGMQFLSPFRLIFDYSNSRIAFVLPPQTP